MTLYENLCIYDARNPNHYSDGENITEPRKNCSCDLCFYGRDKLAVICIELLESLEDCRFELELARMRETDEEVREEQKKTIISARAAIAKAKGG